MQPLLAPMVSNTNQKYFYNHVNCYNVFCFLHRRWLFNSGDSCHIPYSVRHCFLTIILLSYVISRTLITLKTSETRLKLHLTPCGMGISKMKLHCAIVEQQLFICIYRHRHIQYATIILNNITN